MDGTQAMSKGLKPSGPESHTSSVLVPRYCCGTLHQLSTSSSSFSPPLFLFLRKKINLSHRLLPPTSFSSLLLLLLVWDGRRKSTGAICTTLSWILLHCLAAAADTHDRLRRLRVCVYRSKRSSGRRGEEMRRDDEERTEGRRVGAKERGGLPVLWKQKNLEYDLERLWSYVMGLDLKPWHESITASFSCRMKKTLQWPYICLTFGTFGRRKFLYKTHFHTRQHTFPHLRCCRL